MRGLVILIVVLASSVLPASASKCYGEQNCDACKNCNYCKNCNTGGEFCGVYYRSRGVTPPWERPAKKPKKAA